VPKRTLPEPFFYFDEANGSSAPTFFGESMLAFIRRLGTKDGILLRCLLNRCWTRYAGLSRKRRDLASRLERGKDREQAGVITELLVSELLDGLYARVEVEPSLGASTVTPDFRVLDGDGNWVIVEATNYMETSDEVHSREVLWGSLVRELRGMIRPLPTWVTVRPIGTPREVALGDQDRKFVRSAIDLAATTGGEVNVSLGADFAVAIEADMDSRCAGRDSVLQWSYEPDGGIVDVPQKLHQIMRKVKDKAERYSVMPRPLVVMVNCQTAFNWYDEYEEIAPLKRMMRDVPCDAVWLFCNLQPANIGICEHHLLVNPQSDFNDTDHLSPLRQAQLRPLYETLGWDEVWNRVVAFDRHRGAEADEG